MINEEFIESVTPETVPELLAETAHDMGYPHKPHARETRRSLQVLRRSPKRSTLDGWKKRGGYKALEKALGMAPADIVERRQGLRAARSRRRRIPDGHEVVVHEAGRRQAALPLLQRRRVRAGHVQGSRDHALDAARPRRGLRDRRVRDRRRDGLHLHPRRVHRAARRGWSAARQGSVRRRHPRHERDGHRQDASTSTCTRAPARTSAAKRRR